MYVVRTFAYYIVYVTKFSSDQIIFQISVVQSIYRGRYISKQQESIGLELKLYHFTCFSRPNYNYIMIQQVWCSKSQHMSFRKINELVTSYLDFSIYNLSLYGRGSPWKKPQINNPINGDRCRWDRLIYPTLDFSHVPSV